MTADARSDNRGETPTAFHESPVADASADCAPNTCRATPSVTPAKAANLVD